MALSYLSGTLLRHDTWTPIRYFYVFLGVYELRIKEEIKEIIESSNFDTTAGDSSPDTTLQENSPDTVLEMEEQEDLRSATSEYEDGTLNITQHKQPNTSVFSKVPNEIWVDIMSHLDYVEKIMLSQVCRRTRALIPSKLIGELSPDAMGQDYNKYPLLKIHAEKDRWNKLVDLDDAGALAGAACSTCKIVHDRSAFEPKMLEKPAAERICRGMQVVFRVCEHEVLDFIHAKYATSTLGRHRELCKKVPHGGLRLPGSFRHQYSESPDWATRWKSAVAKKLKPDYMHREERMPGVAKNRTIIAAGFHPELQRHYLEEILAEDERPICTHLRYCDVMATWSKDEKYLDHGPKICHHPFCLTAYGFVTKDKEYVTFVVERYLGMARNPADPYWLEMATEMKGDPLTAKNLNIVAKAEEVKAGKIEDSDDDSDEESDACSDYSERCGW